MKKLPKVLLLIDTSRESGRKLLLGIAKYSRLHGPWSFNRRSVYFFEWQTEYSMSRQLEKETLSQLRKWGANGVIATNVNNPRQFEEILAVSVPTILLGGYTPQKNVPGWHCVRSDSHAIAKKAAEHLLDRGYRNFSYCGYYNLSWSKERGACFEKIIAEAGYKVHCYKPQRLRTNRLWANEQTIIADWLTSLPRPLGLMACNDERGHNVLEACKMAGLNVPDDVAVIGVDNDQLVCEVSEPPLSSIPLNNERAGYDAAELLAKLMAGKTLRHQEIIVQPTSVVSRESTDNLAIEDNDISKAIRFIREHDSELVQVGDVVDAVPMSRRSLERSFRKLLGRSVFEEIKRVHVNKFALMLVETNMSISQIALTLGHQSSENITRYFQGMNGMSPTAYRKKYGIR